jgi:TRAP-type C4-dicarboxylate transport system substrate-binding protein
MKKTLTTLKRTLRAAALTTLAMSPLVAIQQAQADTYKWITFKPQSAGDAQVRSTEWFVDEFAKRTGGKHKIQMFWGGSVAKTGEVPDALGSGLGDFGDIVTPYFPDKFLLNNAVGFFIPQPNSVIEIANLMEQWHRDYPPYEQELARYNLKALGYRPLESYGFLCTKPVRSLDDFKGLRIRTYGFAYPALVEALGAAPVSINTAETYEALERAIIDCTPIGPALARGWKYDEIAKYYIEFPIGTSFGHLIAMNLDTYNDMDSETRTVVDQLGHEYATVYNEMLQQDIDHVLTLWKEELGVEVIPFPQDGIDLIVNSEKVQAVRQEWAERARQFDVPTEEIIAELQP